MREKFAAARKKSNLVARNLMRAKMRKKEVVIVPFTLLRIDGATGRVIARQTRDRCFVA